MDRANIEKIAQTDDDRILLAKVWDKIQIGIRKNVRTNSCFLSLRELNMTRYLFGDLNGLHAFGGYADAERQMLIYLPDYLDEAALTSGDSPLVCLRASFYQQNDLTHRDFLGALMGAGIARETVGDICVDDGSCVFFVTAEVAPYILQNFIDVGRVKLNLEQIPLNQVHVPEPKFKEIYDTVASIRLDSVISAGFRIGRSIATQYITAGKVAIDGLPCEKPDKNVTQGVKISVRGLGKMELKTINGQTKKGRYSLTLHRYI